MTSANTPSISPLVRTAIFVRDLDRASQFYCEVFQLSDKYVDTDLPQDSVRTLLGVPKDSYVRCQILRAAAHNKGMIGLFEVTNPAPPAIERGGEACRVGESCLVFYCTDLDPVLERLAKWDVTFVAPPTHFQFNEVIGQRETIFRDIDGMLINLIERPVDDAG